MDNASSLTSSMVASSEMLRIRNHALRALESRQLRIFMATQFVVAFHGGDGVKAVADMIKIR